MQTVTPYSQNSSVQPDMFNSVTVNLNGRYMLEDRSENPCVVIEMSPGTALLSGLSTPRQGERVIAYVDHIGRIEGFMQAMLANGFLIALQATEYKQDKLAAQLTWLANRHELGLAEDRRHERVAPRKVNQVLTMQDGRQYPCKMIDISMSGAAIEIDVRPAINSSVTLGSMRGTVMRHFAEGIAIEFTAVQNPDTLEKTFG